MLESFRIITNNPAVVEKNYAENEYYDVDVLKLFQMVAGETAKGYRLLSHPLTSSVRPDITPYKTVFLSNSMVLNYVKLKHKFWGMYEHYTFPYFLSV